MLVRNVGRSKCMFMYCHQIAEQNHNIMVANKLLENVAEFKYCK
jgi:hypothetical protein